MGDNFAHVNIADWATANANVGLTGAFPDQPIFVPLTLTRFQQRREGESCAGAAGVCAPGLYCAGGGPRAYTCCRLPWDPQPSYPYYKLYRTNSAAQSHMRGALSENSNERFLY